MSCFFAIIQASKDGWSAINFHQCVGEMRDDDDDVFIRIAFGLYIQNTHSNHMNMIMLTKKDGRGSALVVALTKSGKRFGGYNPLGWMSSDDYGNTNNAFLWFERNGKGVKCPILSGGNAAIFDFATGGPTFGSADLCIGPPEAAVMGGFSGPDMENVSSIAGDLRKGKSSVGGAYGFVRGWPVAGKFGVVEVEVYCNLEVGKRLAYGNRGLFSFFG